jgi:hypothetical protein
MHISMPTFTGMSNKPILLVWALFRSGFMPKNPDLIFNHTFEIEKKNV